MASPLGQRACEEDEGHIKMDTSTLSYQAPFMALICICSSEDEPTNSSDTKETKITDTVIAMLRLRPWKTWEKINLIRIKTTSAVGAVDAACLVTHHVSLFKFDYALAHLVYDFVVVGGHNHGGSLAVNPV